MLTDLCPDVLLRIFSLVDVCTILSLSQVNRLLNEVALTKQLWIWVLRRCSPGYVLTRPPNEALDMLTTGALIEEVRRAVHGPRTWSSRMDVPATILHKAVLRLGESRFAQLLPGGTHILNYRGVVDGGRSRMIECLEVESGRRVWGWERAGCAIFEVAIGFRESVSDVVVALSVIASGGSELILIKADLSTGQSIEMLHLLVAAPPWRQQLSGDFYVGSLHPLDGGASFLLLVNWRTEKYCHINITTLDQGGLFPGHLVISSLADPWLRPQPKHTTEIKIYPLTVFTEILLPLTPIGVSHGIDLGLLSCARIPVADNGNSASSICREVKVSVTPSILRDETYDLAISVTELVPPHINRLSSFWREVKYIYSGDITMPSLSDYTSRTAVTRHRISLPDSSAFSSIVPKSVVRHTRGLVSASNAGYGLEQKGVFCYVYPLHEREVQEPKQLPLLLPTGTTAVLTSCDAIVVNKGFPIRSVRRGFLAPLSQRITFPQSMFYQSYLAILSVWSPGDLPSAECQCHFRRFHTSLSLFQGF
ncbi:hypothetical protein DFH06DRAFT_1301698 [Mycena polygramma]|nr:hypothetical protein DFH06DRAFT_1301698 [Mycena polygramma]